MSSQKFLHILDSQILYREFTGTALLLRTAELHFMTGLLFVSVRNFAHVRACTVMIQSSRILNLVYKLHSAIHSIPMF